MFECVCDACDVCDVCMCNFNVMYNDGIYSYSYCTNRTDRNWVLTMSNSSRYDSFFHAFFLFFLHNYYNAEIFYAARRWRDNRARGQVVACKCCYGGTRHPRHLFRVVVHSMHDTAHVSKHFHFAIWRTPDSRIRQQCEWCACMGLASNEVWFSVHSIRQFWCSSFPKHPALNLLAHNKAT